MSKIGKISVIRKEISVTGMQTMESSLHHHSMTRVPGTGVYKFPYKELDGKYRTGLDPNASYIRRILDPVERELEVKRVTDLKKKLQTIFGDIDLSPRSDFWNFSLGASTNDERHVQPYKLIDGDNLFDLTSPIQELTFSWLRVHPTIASSYQAWLNGDYPSETQFYVSDEDIENEIVFKKKQSVNKAISKFDNMSMTKKRKVARLLGLPVTDDTKDEVVYNLVDGVLKDEEIKSGAYQGMNSIDIFMRFANMNNELLNTRDLIKQAVTYSVYRINPKGEIYKGDYMVAESEEDLIKHLMDADNQEDLLSLEAELKNKKLALL